ncbi:DUF2637 domain-containing protein [Arthrobacter sp. 162MFSha1.1]|uniref:DUF2637 domain-containing protein n=1 Tax=Arthrobacter sp. 162MFSha1.1 TaxID=1151119 RepID=UPI00036E03B9|nr:DUF2637 domain-containing protein [Arthrobacter sp. 162MFSha1.1]
MSPARKTARISPESRPIAYTAVGVASLIYAGAFTTSFFGQAALAVHMAIPAALQYVVPVVIDLALVLFTLATLLRKTRGESTLWTNIMTGFWTATSIVSNIAHVLVPAGPAESWSFGTYTGAALSALMPLGALGASLVLENLLIEPPTATAAVSAPKVERPAAEVAEARVPVVEASAPVTRPAASEAAVMPAPALVAVPTPATPSRPKAAKVATPNAKPSLTPEQRRQILALAKGNELSKPKIAEEVGASLSSVKRVIKEAGDAAEQVAETRAA